LEWRVTIVELNGELPTQGCTTFCYCRPH